jgi:hypothetical protein
MIEKATILAVVELLRHSIILIAKTQPKEEDNIRAFMVRDL